MKKRFLPVLLACALVLTSFSIPNQVQAEGSGELVNLAMQSGSKVTVSAQAEGNGPEYLNDGIISDREGSAVGGADPRSRWRTYPEKDEQWAAVMFDGEQEVRKVVWYALVDEGVDPSAAYTSVKMQIYKDGAWTDSEVNYNSVEKYTGEYSDSTGSDAYIYEFDFGTPVTTEGVRVVVNAVKYAAATEFQVWGKKPAELTNLAMQSGSAVTVSKMANETDGPDKLNDGIISDREGPGFSEPRSRWHTWPDAGEQWAQVMFDGEQEVHKVVWYALVDEGVKPSDAYTSVKVQVYKDGAWKDSGVNYNTPVEKYTGEYSDSANSDAYIYEFDFGTPVTTEGVRVFVNATKYAGATEFQVWGIAHLKYGFNLSCGKISGEGKLPVTVDVDVKESAQTLYVKLKDTKGIEKEQTITIPAGQAKKEGELDLSGLAYGNVEITASLNSDYTNSKSYQVNNPIPSSVIDDIYDEIKTPYEYDVVLSPTGKSGDYDSELVDNPNVFRIPGDDEYVYMTYVGHDGEGYRTGLARSKDLVTWERIGVILDNGEAGQWDSYNAAGYIVRDHEWGSLPTPHINKNGKYCMTYLASDTPGYEAGTKKAGVAFADSIFDKDGTLTQWDRYEDPVLEGSTDPKYSYEKNIIWKLQAIYNEEDGKYYGFYNAATGPEIMCGAVSDDLIHWTRMENNPLLDTDQDVGGGTWGGSHNADADVMKVGDYWVMHYFTSTPSDGIVDSFAVSTDLVNWTKAYKTTTTRNSTWSSTFAHKPCVVKNNGVVYHYYCAVGDQGRVIAVDTSIDLSVVKQARSALSGDLTTGQRKALQKSFDNLQTELRKEGGSLEEVEAARDSLQTLLANLDEYDSSQVEEAIDNIGAITVNSGDAIQAAREAYDALTDADKAKVDNYQVLTDAESAYQELMKKVEELEKMTKEGKEEKDYTPATWKPYKLALDNAKAVLQDETADMDKVDAALNSLKEAANALKKTEAAKNPSQNPNKGNDSTNSNKTAGNGKVTSVETGDNNNLLVWLTMLLVSCGGFVGVSLYNKRRKYNK